MTLADSTITLASLEEALVVVRFISNEAVISISLIENINIYQEN